MTASGEWRGTVTSHGFMLTRCLLQTQADSEEEEEQADQTPAEVEVNLLFNLNSRPDNQLNCGP